MQLEFCALGGALDERRRKPPIGGSMYALIDTDLLSALVVDCGAYPVSDAEKERQSEELVALIEKKDDPKIEKVGNDFLPSLPLLGTDYLAGDFDIDLAQITEKAFPQFDDLREMNEIHLVISHAHADHIGALVFFKKLFPDARIYMTAETKEISEWSWYDSIKVARREGFTLPFTSWDIENLIPEITLVETGRSYEMGPFSVSFTQAGHILGAISALVKPRNGNGPSFFFTGDISFSHQHSVSPAMLPEEEVDFLVTESTYGGQIQEERASVEGRLARDVRAVLEGGGKVLFPTLSIGRPLEILAVLKEAGITNEFPVKIDGAAKSIAEIYQAHGKTPAGITRHFIGNARERDQFIFGSAPGVAIVPSSSLAGGHSVRYAAELAGSERNAIFFSAYLDPCSPGYRMLRMQPGRKIRIRRDRTSFATISLNAHVGQYGLSAHASHTEILETIDRLLRPDGTAFLVHGEERGMNEIIRYSGKSTLKTFLNRSYRITS